jgi:hypothetical protein
MTNQHAQSGNFCFDEAKSFSENCDTFLSSLVSIDAGMAAILRDNWDVLVAIVQEGERNSKARGKFNTEVAMALDSLLTPADPKDGA